MAGNVFVETSAPYSKLCAFEQPGSCLDRKLVFCTCCCEVALNTQQVK